jgi:hypothetical protein
MRPLVGDVTFFAEEGMSLPVYGLKEPSLGNMIRSRGASSAALERGRQQKWTRSGGQSVFVIILGEGRIWRTLIVLVEEDITRRG